MKKYFLITVFIVIVCNIFGENISISGGNELKFIYRDVKDSLNQFMEDEFKFDLTYKNFRFGMKYIAELPKYDEFYPDTKLDSDKLISKWDERYLEFETDNFYIRGGTFEAAFGSGIVLNAYNNTDFDEDNHLEGCKISISFCGDDKTDELSRKLYKLFSPIGEILSIPFIFNEITFSGIYGISNNDLVSGLDIEIQPTDFLKIGFSGLNEKFEDSDSYNTKNIFGERVEISKNIFDAKIEYAENSKDFDGSALYGNFTTYFDKFTLTAVYKNYQNFVDRFSELPTVNYSEQPIAEYGNHQDLGYEEEGIQGIIHFNPSFENEFIVNYAEGWSFDKTVTQSDFHAEWLHSFENSSLTLQYSQLERFDDKTYYPVYYWSKEMKPAISYDFIANEIPILLKASFKTKLKNNYGEETTEYEPILQTDFAFGDYSVSIIASHNFHDFDEISEITPKVGAELIASVWEHSSIKLFVGSEEGGQICRNGICQNQAAFDGVRLTVSTRF
ncbi:MAG: hypothetical protein H8E33_04775 [Candidatus Cloacimonetes bacterium]|nr:hypothetical protein [Candidatus Cloacimonadota bacterium]